jgi:hypothetical protein
MTPIAAWSPDEFLAGGFLVAGRFLVAGALLTGAFLGGVRPAGTFFIGRVGAVPGGCEGQRDWVSLSTGTGVGRVVAGGGGDGSRGPCGTPALNWSASQDVSAATG